MIKDKNKFMTIKIIVSVVLICVYILPVDVIETKYPISKLTFVGVVGIIYMLTIIKTKKVSIKEIIFVVLLLSLSVFSRNLNFLMFVTIPFLNRIMKYEDQIQDYLKKSKILYICLIFTIAYSIMYAGTNGRYAFTAVKETNQSGLAIFCLALMLIKKNKKIGIATLLFGLLTISRSYYLAVFMYLIFKIKFIKKIINNNKIIKLCNYTNLTIISSIILILLGIFYINQYQQGNIYWGDDISNRLYNFLDYSNFFRFTAIIILLMIIKMFPSKLLFGVTREEFINLGNLASNDLGIPYKYVVPHNLFYSHLKMYGFFAIIETIYISSVLKKIVNNSNFSIYIAIVLYSFLLGAGMYSYWLYLSVFTLVMYTNNCNSEEKENENSINR